MIMHLGRTITTGVITGAMLVGLFAATNAGRLLRPDDSVVASDAPSMVFGMLGLLSLFSVVVSFGRWSSRHERQEHEGSDPTFYTVLNEYSPAGILLVGIVQGACLSSAMLICRGFAVAMSCLLVTMPLAIGTRKLALVTRPA